LSSEHGAREAPATNAHCFSQFSKRVDSTESMHKVGSSQQQAAAGSRQQQAAVGSSSRQQQAARARGSRFSQDPCT